MKRINFLLVLFLLVAGELKAQENTEKEHHKNHVCVSFGGVNFLSNEPGWGLHSHYIRKFGKSVFGNRWSD